MAAFTWDDNFSLNIEPMDRQHKQIFEQMALINRSMAEKAPPVVLDRLLTAFGNYSKTHFYDEERLMEEMNYPAIAGHKRQHDLFTAQLDWIRSRDPYSPAGAGFDAITSLKDWFVNHILSEDMLYSEFFINQQRTEPA